MKTINHTLKISFLFLWALLIAACGQKQVNEQHAEPKRPQKVIFLIGDGMGLTQISSLYFMQEKDATNFNKFTTIGLINTRSSSHKITDSAAGATAFSCGKKTYNGSIGMDKDSSPVKSITELFPTYQYGLVATSSITHATPASFYAHNVTRNAPYEIAKDLLTSNISFFAAGGLSFLSPIWNDLESSGFVLDSNTLKMQQGQKLGFALAQDGMPKMSEGREDFLPSATSLALSFLESKSDSFFLMVEGSQIDWGGHQRDAGYILEEMKDFDKTLGVALEYAMKRDDVLVLVTADHETGGFSLASKETVGADGKPKKDYNIVSPLFTTGGHTATMVPVFAFGAGAENFSGMYENTEIFEKLSSLMREAKVSH